LNISTIFLVGSLLVSAGVCANGNIPVLELDFTRSATETLKKHGINDACIIAAGNPTAFTYCREGSATLWKYQALDLDRQVVPFLGTKLASMVDGQISIAEVESIVCEQETLPPLVDPAVTRGLALSLIVLFLCLAVRYTYQASKDGDFDRAMLAGPHQQRLNGSAKTRYSTERALGAFVIAAGIAFVYFGYTAF
jgi:hypothetical protein